MRWKVSDFVAGLFVILGLILIVAMFVTVRGQFNRQDSYYSYFSNVAGLKTGAAVVYEGYIIGSVTGITPEPSDTGMRFKIDIGIEAGWAIPKDSTSQIAALSLLSAPAIQIEAGSAGALAPNSEISAVDSGNIMADLSRTADRLTAIAETSLAPLLNTTANLLENEGRDALASVSGLATQLDSNAPAILGGVKNTVQNLELASANISALTDSDSFDGIDDMLSDLQQAADNIATLSAQSAAIVDSAGQIISPDRVRTIDSFLNRLNNASGSVERSMASLERLSSEENMTQIEALIQNVGAIREELLYASRAINTAATNAASLTNLGEDRIESFLQRLESSALNIEEMTAQLRDDPSILIRGTN